MDIKCVGEIFIILCDGNFALIILNILSPKTNIYPERVAMFSLRFYIYKYIRTKNIAKTIKYKSNIAQNEIHG